MKTLELILSCEHAVNNIPKNYQHYFAAYKKLLNTHRGIDFGALSIAEDLSQAFKRPLTSATCSRLLIDCNRSLKHKNCFSEITIDLTEKEKLEIIESFYHPYRKEVIQTIKEVLATGAQVLHLSIHSFVPILNGVKRNADLGLLYDPKRPAEKIFANSWQELLKKSSAYKIRKNYPYLGSADGFTTNLRKIFPNEAYLGIEVEVNQALTSVSHTLESISKLLINSLKDLLNQYNHLALADWHSGHRP